MGAIYTLSAIIGSYLSYDDFDLLLGLPFFFVPPRIRALHFRAPEDTWFIFTIKTTTTYPHKHQEKKKNCFTNNYFRRNYSEFSELHSVPSNRYAYVQYDSFIFISLALWIFSAFTFFVCVCVCTFVILNPTLFRVFNEKENRDNLHFALISSSCNFDFWTYIISLTLCDDVIAAERLTFGQFFFLIVIKIRRFQFMALVYGWRKYSHIENIPKFFG